MDEAPWIFSCFSGDVVAESTSLAGFIVLGDFGMATGFVVRGDRGTGCSVRLGELFNGFSIGTFGALTPVADDFFLSVSVTDVANEMDDDLFSLVARFVCSGVMTGTEVWRVVLVVVLVVLLLVVVEIDMALF